MPSKEGECGFFCLALKYNFNWFQNGTLSVKNVNTKP